jgi:DNA-binding NtrC family response regulator
MNGLNSSKGSGKDQRIRVLVLDRVEKDREMMGRFLAAWNFEPLAARNLKEAREAVNERGVSIALISHPVRGGESLEMVRELRQADPGLETILLAAEDSPKFATDAFRAGVYDCLKTPIDFKQLSRDLNTLREAVQRRMERKVWDAGAKTAAALEGLVGISASMQAVFASLRRSAMEDSPVLITGLIGTGKEMAARALHTRSRRATNPMVVYRCCGVTESLAESELFGAPGRSASSSQQSGFSTRVEQSVLESARGGTLLLDEIGDLPASIQERLAKTLQDDCAAGSNEQAKAASIRLLAASRLNLAEQAGRNQFNGELYGLLSHNVIHLPSLSERQEDIPLLCRHFQEKFNSEFGKQKQSFSQAAERALMSYPWPGNVRELENVIGRACLLADQDWIELSDLSIAAPLNASAWPERRSDWSSEAAWRQKEIDSKEVSRKLSSASQIGVRHA